MDDEVRKGGGSARAKRQSKEEHKEEGCIGGEEQVVERRDEVKRPGMRNEGMEDRGKSHGREEGGGCRREERERESQQGRDKADCVGEGKRRW